MCHSVQRKAKKVRQRDFGIAARGQAGHVLRTENISTCTSFAALNASKGIGFLVHIDTPFSMSLIREMVQAFKEHLSDFEGFEMRMDIGIDGYLMPLNWVPKILLCWRVRRKFGRRLRPQGGT
jgi:hypothetical protein